MKRTRIQAGVAAVATVVSSAWLVNPAGAAGYEQIEGVAVYDGNSESPGNCDELASILTLELVDGNLIGCWYTTSASATQTRSGVVHERGTETFIGEWNGEPVRFDTTYNFTGKFDADFNEIHGRCQHPIVAGDVEGRVDFKDEVTTGLFYYRGHLR